MAKVASKRLVIDASVARAAGTSEHPVSSACREALQTILKVCHKAVATSAIRDEWKVHRSRFFAAWHASMTARKKVVRTLPMEDDDLRQQIDRLNVSGEVRDTMKKDIHLLCAALAVDQIVISMDETARDHFRGLAMNAAALRNVIWVNPTRDDEHVVDWLRRGAREEPRRRLGFQPREE